jgi:hypothetical protein
MHDEGRHVRAATVRARRCAVLGVMLLGGWNGGGVGRIAWAADGKTAPDYQTQYQAVLAAMKSPAVTGLLITEIGADSAAGAAGAMGGDILINYAGKEVRTLKDLRANVADMIATAEVADVKRKVLMQVRRGNQELLLQVEREPLGIRVIEVEAGVAAPLNPPASPRGSIKLAWEELLHDRASSEAFFRTDLVSGGVEDVTKDWAGWQRRTLTLAGQDALAGEALTGHVELGSNDGKVIGREQMGYRFRTGDYSATPAFVLESADVVVQADDAEVTTHAEHVGAVLRWESGTVWRDRQAEPVKAEAACPLNAIIPAMAPVVAAAMPHVSGGGAGDEQAVLDVSVISTRDFQTRPGYALVTRGKRHLGEASTMPAASIGGQDGWCVELMHCGVVAERFWFSDDRRLLRLEMLSGTTTVSRRVGSDTDAQQPIALRAATTQK